MGPANCNIHGIQAYVSTSPKLATAIKNKEFIKSSELAKIIIYSPDLARIFEHIVDANFVKSFVNNKIKTSELILIDRNKSNKKQNDRLLVQHILKELKWVCPVCLSKISKE